MAICINIGRLFSEDFSPHIIRSNLEKVVANLIATNHTTHGIKVKALQVLHLKPVSTVCVRATQSEARTRMNTERKE